MCDISTYKNRIHDFAERLDPYTFSNEGIEHAEIVLSEMYEHANEFVYVYCGHLSEQLTSRPLFFNALTAYLACGGKQLKVLIADKPNPEDMSPALIRILEKCKKNKSENSNDNSIECRLLKDTDGINSHFQFNEKKSIHFSVADNRAFRLEIEPEKYRAFCSFNNVEISTKLSSIFMTYFNKSQLIE